jgi:hypothetical protein
MRVIPDVIDYGDADEMHIDSVYRVSQNTLCVEFFINKIIDGMVEKVVALRTTWDLACWLGMQETITRMFGDTGALAVPTPDDENAAACVVSRLNPPH